MLKKDNKKSQTPYEEACMLYKDARGFTDKEQALYQKMLAQKSTSLNINIFEIMEQNKE